MDRSKAPKQRKAADTAASVQAFAGSILNKHRPGRGRDKYGSASMLHAKPKGEPAGVQQRIHIHVTPPRGADTKPKRKTEQPQTVRIIEREKVRVEHKTIVLREIVRIIDNQRTARALAMTAPVRLESSPEHRQFPDAAAPSRKQETGSRRQDHHSGSQPAASTLVTAIHKETGKPIWQGRTMERLRRIIAAGEAGTALAPLRRDHARREGAGGREAAGTHIAAKKQPLTHARREASSAEAERKAARGSEQAKRSEQAAKRREAEAVEAERKAARGSEQAKRSEQAAKRREAEAVEAERKAARGSEQAKRSEQAAKRREAEAVEAERKASRGSEQAKRSEQAAKRRAAKAAEAEQTAARLGRPASGPMISNSDSRRQTADVVHKTQKSESETSSAAGGEFSDNKARSSSSTDNPPNLPSASVDRKPGSIDDSRLHATSGKAEATVARDGRPAGFDADVPAAASYRKRNASRLLFYNSAWNAEPWLITERKLQRRLTRQWLASRPAGRETGQPSSDELRKLPIKARKLIYRQADGVLKGERRTPHALESSQSNRSKSAVVADPPSGQSNVQRFGNVQDSETTRSVHSAAAQPPALQGIGPSAQGEAITVRDTWRALSAMRNRRMDAGNDAGRRFPELLTARRRPAASEALPSPVGLAAQPRPIPPPSMSRPAPTPSSPHLSANARQETGRAGAASAIGNATIQPSPKTLGDNGFSLSISRHAAAPIVVRRATLRPGGPDHAGRQDGGLPSGGRPAVPLLQRYAERAADGRSLELQHSSGLKESYTQARLRRMRPGSFIFRRHLGRTIVSQEGSPGHGRAPRSATSPVAGIAGTVDGTNSSLSRRNNSPNAEAARETTSGHGRQSTKTASGVSLLGGWTVAAGGSAARLLNVLRLQGGSERGLTGEKSAAYKPIGLVLRRIPESLGARLVRLARSNREANVAPASSQAGNVSQRADSKAGAGSTTPSRRNRQASGTLTGRQHSVIQTATADRAASPAASANGEVGGRRGAASLQAISGAGQSATVAGLIGLRTATAPIAGTAQSQTAAQSVESRRRLPAVAATANETSQRRTLVQRTAANRNGQTPAGAKPSRIAAQSIATAQRAAAMQRSPLIARPFAIAGQQSTSHTGGDSQSADGRGVAGASTLAYSRRAASDGSPYESGSSQQPFASAGAGARGGATPGLTHRTPPAAPAEPPRQVQVEAPREMEPEKLQRMIMKMPQLNPEAIADRVYKALERKMKLEQRRNGF